MAKKVSRADQHARKLVKVLKQTANAVGKLSLYAQRHDIWPKTTQTAYFEALQLVHRTEIRIAAKNADAA